MTKNEAINYAAKNWNWEKRDITLAKKYWNQLGADGTSYGDKVLALVEQEQLSQADIICLTMARIAATQRVTVKRTWNPSQRVKAALATVACLAGLAFPFAMKAAGYLWALPL